MSELRPTPGTSGSCPHCGAVLRLGVWLTAKEAAVFDKIAKSRKGELAHPRNTHIRPNLFRQWVWRIRSKLEETDFTIKAKRGQYGGYYLEKVR